MTSETVFYFIHGFPDSEKVWLEFESSLQKKISFQMECVYFSSPQGSQVQSLDHLKEIHMQNLKPALESGKGIVIFAHDLGVPQAWMLGKCLGDSLKALVLFNGLSVHQLRDRILSGNWKQLKRSWYMGAFMFPGLPELIMKPEKLSKDLMRLGKKDPDLRFKDYYLYRKLIRLLGEKCKKIEAPVFQISSRRDPFILPMTNPELDKYAFKYSTQILDCGHWSIQEKEDSCASSVVEFLTKEKIIS